MTRRICGRCAVADAVFWGYLALVLVALGYVLVEPAQAADLVRGAVGWLRGVAELVVRSLPKPVPAP